MSRNNNDISLEDELLQITEKKNPPKKSRADSDEDASEGEDRSKRKSKSSDSKKPLKKRRTESDDEKDGSDSSSDDDVFHDGFEDDLMGDDEDRERLAQLPELEREDILGERYERRKELKDQWETKRRLKESRRSARGKETEKDKKARDMRDRGKKKQEKKGKALSELKKMRAKITEKDDDEAEDDDRAEDGGDDDDYAPVKEERAPASQERESYYSDDDSKSAEDDRPLTFTELNSIRLPRESLIKWLTKPFFESIVPGFFVRIGIGPDPNTHTNVYRAARIEEVKVGKVNYTLPGHPDPTNKLLSLRIGNATKDCKMDTISNKSFSEPEFKKYASDMNKAKEGLPTAADVKRKVKDLSLAHDYKYTPDDIQNMLEAKRKVGKLPIKIAAEKARMFAARDAAKESDPTEYVRLCEEIVRLEELAKQRHDMMDKVTKTNAVNNINLKNKQRNFDILAESSKLMKNVSAANGLDPFSRRKTAPRVMLARKKAWELPPPDEKPAEVKDTKDNNSNNNNNNNDTLKKSLSLSSDKLRDPGKGLHDEHNGIDIDIPVDNLALSFNSIPKQISQPTIAPLPVSNQTATAYVSPASTATPAASKLSLADYMRRRRALVE